MYLEELEMWIPEDVDPRLEAMQDEWNARESYERELREEADRFNEMEALANELMDLELSEAASHQVAEMEDIPF